jgi:hypothetical protein
VVIPANTVGTVTRIDNDGDIYVDFGAALNPNKMIRTQMFDQIEAVSDSVCSCLLSMLLHLF